MNKTIKVEERVHQELDDFRAKRETFSQVIDRLLTIAKALLSIQTTVEGARNYALYIKSKIGQEKSPGG